MNYIKYQVDHTKKITHEIVVELKNLNTLVSSFKKYKNTPITTDAEPTEIFVITKSFD